MEAFLGSWKLSKKVNIQEYLKATGHSDEHNDDAIETFHKDGEYVVLTIRNGHHTRDIKFKLNEPFDEDTKEGKQCHSVISLVGADLVQVQKWDGKQSTIVREIKDHRMIVTMKFDHVEAVSMYKKI